VFSDELAAHYQDFVAGTAPHLQPLSLQYADYAIWKNQQERTLTDLHREYWQNKLTDLPNCEIPPDYPRTGANRQRGYILSTLLPTDLTQKLAALSRVHACTFYTTCLAALKILIAHYTRQTDIYVGTLVAGRDRPELETLIGLFINTLILRTDLSGDPMFLELLERVRETVEGGLAHQDLPFQQVAESLRFKRHPNRPTIYSINFIYQRDFVRPLEFAGLTLAPVPSKSPGAIYDLNFFMVERSDGWRLSCEYSYDLYEASSVNRMLAQFRGLLEQVLANPQRRISEFAMPTEVGDPLPPFVPRAAQHQTATVPERGERPERSRAAAFTFKKILSRVYTQFGKN
jgi:non-ribosomal peptide synthetase component F